jgi:hypothetical protein
MNMHATGGEQLLDSSDEGVRGRVKGMGRDLIPHKFLHEPHFAGVASEILQPPMNPRPGLKR